MNDNGSGLGSIFATIARSILEKEKTEPVVVVCPACRSDDTKPVDLEFEMYECTNCGAVFIRQPQEA